MPNPFFEAWTGPFEVPPFGAIAPEHFMPAFERAFAEHDAEIAAIAAQAERADLRQHHRGAGALRPAARARRRRVLQSGRRPHQRRAARDRARDRAAARRPLEPAHPAERALFRRIDALYARATRSASTAEQARVLERYHIMFKRAGAGARRRRQEAAGRDHRAAGDARHDASARTCSPTSSPTRWCSRARTISPACRTSCAPPRAPRRPSAACRQARHHAVALERRAVPAILRAPRPAREGVPRLDRARRQRRHDRQQGDRSPRWWRCAPSARGCSATRPSRITGSTTPWRRRRRRCATCSTGSGRRRAPARSPTATPCRRWCGRRAATSSSRRGTGATTPRSCARPLRYRRGDGQAVLPARPHHRGGVLHRLQAVRPDLRAPQGRRGLASRRAGLGGARRRRPPSRPVLRRLFRARRPSAAAPG